MYHQPICFFCDGIATNVYGIAIHTQIPCKFVTDLRLQILSQICDGFAWVCGKVSQIGCNFARKIFWRKFTSVLRGKFFCRNSLANPLRICEEIFPPQISLATGVLSCSVCANGSHNSANLKSMLFSHLEMKWFVFVCVKKKHRLA